MSDTFHAKSIKAARKIRICEWCGELMLIGQPYESYRWRDGDDHGTVQMHPECLEAFRRTSLEEGGWVDWELFANQRGLSWKENKKQKKQY